MQLDVYFEERHHRVTVDPETFVSAAAIFTRMDRDMDGGWQMSREHVDRPNSTQRAQIVADKLATALDNDNRPLAEVMAAYLLSRMPTLQGVRVASDGEMQDTELLF